MKQIDSLLNKKSLKDMVVEIAYDDRGKPDKVVVSVLKGKHRRKTGLCDLTVKSTNNEQMHNVEAIIQSLKFLKSGTSIELYNNTRPCSSTDMSPLELR